MLFVQKKIILHLNIVPYRHLPTAFVCSLDHHFFMATAFLVAKRSQSPKPVGAVLVNDSNQIIGIGYNKLDEHAEEIAINNAWQTVENCTLYVTLHPCNECSEIIISNGITKVYFNYTKFQSEYKTILEEFEVERIQYQKDKNWFIKFTNLGEPDSDDESEQSPEDSSESSEYDDLQQFNAHFSWNNLFMAIAYLVATMKGYDSKGQVGALIVNNDKQIIGIGYKTFNADGTEVHAEINAIKNSSKELVNCTLYIGLYPCNNCAAPIKDAGIKQVVYNHDRYANIQKKLKLFGVDCIPHCPPENISISYYIDYRD